MFSVKIEWVDKLHKSLGKPRFYKVMNRSIKKAIIFLRGEATKETPMWVAGDLRRWYREKFKNLEGKLYNIRKYWYFVHEGTRPHWTSIRNLDDWARIRWIPVRALQISIARKGTKANPFMTKTIEKSEKKVIRIIDKEISKAFT